MYNQIKKYIFLVCASVILLYLVSHGYQTYYMPRLIQSQVMENQLINELDTNPNQTKYILYWMPFWFHKHYFIGYGYQPFEKCKYKNCFATDDRKYLPMEKYDALFFHGIHEKSRIEIPSVRKPHQYYVYMNVEAPVYITPNLKPYKSFFNWTMSYRFDSDIIKRHGVVEQNETDYQFPSEEILKGKTKLIAWFASNCKTPSKREILVKEIQKYATVDVYGSCGTLKCKHKNGDLKLSSEECYDMVERDYKFYLSFENSYCRDYSTEKLYNLLRRNVIPVVYGFGDYKLSAPPNSVINVEDFQNVSQLVSYLMFLDQNDDEYLKYFQWKKYFTIDLSTQWVACQLCNKLNKAEEYVYDDLYSWWWGENRSVCKLDKYLPQIVSKLL